MKRPPARRSGAGAITRLHRSGAPVALFTFFCFGLTFSPARIARAAPAPPDSSSAPVSESAPGTAATAESTPSSPGTAAQSTVDSPQTQATAQSDSSIPKQLPAQDQSSSDPSNSPKQIDPDQGQISATPKASSLAPGGAPQSPTALPTGADKSGVTNKTISIPKGAGKIDGMGESFSAQLSTGIATFSVPFALPKARGGAQPSLGLSYSSSGGYGLAGVGWSVGVPFIARQTDRGVPSYNDQASWQGEQDRFVFNGGQELVPICTITNGICPGALTAAQAGHDERFPAWAEGQQYFRPRVEGSFLRFFWSADHKTWRVQDKSGVTMELGVPLDGTGYDKAIEVNPENTSEIYRWHLVRQYDTYGTANPAGGVVKPNNVVVYRYLQDGGSAYLSDIYDTPPPDQGSASPLPTYAHHTHLVYEARTDPTSSWRSGWLMQQNLRLSGVDVASKAFGDDTTDPRHMVRRYHLAYDPAWHASLLSSVQVEGRCTGSENGAPAEDGLGLLPATTSCKRLPAMTFDYTHVDPYATDGSAGVADLTGYEGFDERVHTMANSPPHSVDEELTDLFDINSDGLPDVLVTAPADYNGGDGVYFNGSGGTADSFGDASVMSVLGVLGANANTITLKNLNVSPLDVDGDGGIDLLHMPEVKTYAVYKPVHLSSGWAWQGRAIPTASGQNPKIDFGKDTLDVQVMDANFDGLVDVVVSTGTEMETFFNLGRYPGGDGQFGHATRTGADTAELSNDPVTSCVPWSSTPIRFSDPDIKIADMNGDGIPDIVRIRQGDVRYWPGRGNGFWGTGKRDDCPGDSFGQSRDIAMTSSPQYSDPNGTGLRLDDVNGDGLADLVQVRFSDVDVWLNIDGQSWTERHIIKNTPAAPSYESRVRLVDINGSSTRDILWGDGNNYRYIDLQGGQQAHILTHVDNGLGKTTDLEYSTSTAEMLAAEKYGQCNATQLAADPWSCAWTKKMPTVTQVVKRVVESDNLTVAGRPPGTYITEYSYRDPVFEGRQREFRGFSRAKSTRIGDDNSPTDVTETTFLLGECKDETPNNGVDDCSVAERWRDNPREALKGLPVTTERYDQNGVYLSTQHTSYTLRTLYHGLDGRVVRHAFESQKDTYLYDTAAFAPATAQSDPLPTVDVDDPNVASDPKATVTLRSSQGVAHLETESTVDDFGNKLTAVDHGCVSGCTDNTPDEVITTTTNPGRPPGDQTGWLWRTVESYVTGSAHAVVRNHTVTEYDDHGNPQDTYAELAGSLALDRFNPSGKGTAPPPAARSTDTAAGAATLHVSHMVYDPDTGNLTTEEGPNGRCRSLGYSSDPYYRQFATSETIRPGDPTSGTPTGFGCPAAGSSNSLFTVAMYDRGFGLVTSVTDMQHQITKVEYDSFGRLTALYRPDPAQDRVTSSVPSVKIEYLLPPDLPAEPGDIVARHSIIYTMTQDGNDVGDANNYLESWSYVDGFGRNIVGLSEADPQNGDGGDWIASNLNEYDNKSAVRRKYLDFYYTGDPKAFPFSAVPTAPYGRQRYDAFGRQLQTYDLDGTVTLASRYHALSSDHWDAADLEPGPHQGTYASEAKDGHGRTIETTERIHSGGSSVIEERHVDTQYLPTGEPEVITRKRAGDQVTRWMQYDSLGRMVLNVEPDTTAGFNPTPGTDPDSMKAWRYAYDDAGDLVGTSDARGCGANYLYDAAGRLTAEDYSPCEASQPAYSVPDLSARTGVEVLYAYDQPPDAILGSETPPGFTGLASDYYLGRLVAVFDRASTTVNAFDARGRVTASAVRVVAKNAQYEDIPVRYTNHWFERKFAFDAADRQIGATTGATVPELQGLPKSAGDITDSTSLVTTEYTRRGTLKQAGGSYQRDSASPNVGSIQRTADGLVQEVHYGDLADTTTHYSYDNRRRLSSVQTYRGPPSAWSSGPTGTPSYDPTVDPNGNPLTFQLLLQDVDYTYDPVNNPTEIHDWRNPAEWPAGAKPVTQKIQYDDLYRATRIDYQYSAGDDKWTDPFLDEDSSVKPTDTRRAKPSPHVSFDNRVLYQSYKYDWLGNTTATDDDAGGFYDRSLGTVTNGTATAGPYQLKHAEIGSGARSGHLDALYDDAGNLTRLDVRRAGPCLPKGSSCNQRFDYRWDEVGRLVEALRWDGAPGDITTIPPDKTAAAHLKYTYDAGDSRVVKQAIDRTGRSRYTVYLFSTLELRRASWLSDHYEDTAATEVAYLSAHGVTLARLWYEPDTSVPTNGGGQLHVFYQLGDQLGSTSVVLDQSTGELVERTTFEGYGATDSDYRPSRWDAYRADKRFTGKEEDVEVGLYYFGKRYLNPFLGRWVSADPLAVQAPGKADPNAYAYVHGRVLQNTDPRGLDKYPKYPEGSIPPPKFGKPAHKIVLPELKIHGAAPKRPYLGTPGVPELPDLTGAAKGFYNWLFSDTSKALSATNPYAWVLTGGHPTQMSLPEASVAPNEKSGELVGHGLALIMPLPGEEAVASHLVEPGLLKLSTFGDRVLEGIRTLAADTRGTFGTKAGGYLVRFGEKMETVESLERASAEAEAHNLPHGVSTKACPRISGTDKAHRWAARSDVEQHFVVEQTGRRPSHHTVHIPKPVTQDVVDLFNKLFGGK